MKKTLPVMLLLTIGAALGGFYFGKKSCAIPPPNTTRIGNDSCSLCELAKKYEPPSRVTPIPLSEGESMRGAYESDNNLKEQTRIIKTDAISFAYYFDSAKMSEKTDSIELILAKHTERSTSDTRYINKFTALVTFTKTNDGVKKYVPFKYKKDGETKETNYLDIMTLCPYDCLTATNFTKK
jgi:hypothetical protein